MKSSAPCCSDLLSHYLRQKCTRSAIGREIGRKLKFEGVHKRDVYNISAPFVWNRSTCLLGRVESRDTDLSDSLFFVERAGVWSPMPYSYVFKGLQDPCITIIDGKLIVGGVQFPVLLENDTIGWRMIFYQGSSPMEMEAFLEGPDNMKDIRLKQMHDGQIAVLTRPWGYSAGRGKIGFTIVSSLDSLTAKSMRDAPRYNDLFADNEWGGVNEVHVLEDNKLGLLGHIACFDDRGHRHYYCMTLIISLLTGCASDLKIICQRSDFPPGPAKRIGLEDVVFSGGMNRRQDGMAELFLGLSDAESGFLLLPDPFVDLHLDANSPIFELSYLSQSGQSTGDRSSLFGPKGV